LGCRTFTIGAAKARNDLSPEIEYGYTYKRGKRNKGSIREVWAYFNNGISHSRIAKEDSSHCDYARTKTQSQEYHEVKADSGTITRRKKMSSKNRDNAQAGKARKSC